MDSRRNLSQRFEYIPVCSDVETRPLDHCQAFHGPEDLCVVGIWLKSNTSLLHPPLDKVRR
jgi:hypothetical protein